MELSMRAYSKNPFPNRFNYPKTLFNDDHCLTGYYRITLAVSGISLHHKIAKITRIVEQAPKSNDRKKLL
jgi:hypothetical protein